MRTLQYIDEHLKPLDDIISNNFLPTLLDPVVTDNERSLFQLPARLGGFTKHEREKKRQYNNRIVNVEHGTFTPLVFSVNGGIAKECLKFHKFVAEKIANKSGCRYEKVISIIKCKLSFLNLRVSLMCVRGSRSFTTHSGNHVVDDFQIAFDYTLG